MIHYVRNSNNDYRCISCSMKNNKRRLGKYHSAETKKKMSEAAMGKKKSEEHRKNISRAQVGVKKPKISGPNHYRWKGGLEFRDITHRMRQSIEWVSWRKEVFGRDSYACMDCGEGGYLEPHHIVPLRIDLTKAYYINNGITLCRPCHKVTMGKEELLVNTYLTMTTHPM